MKRRMAEHRSFCDAGGFNKFFKFQVAALFADIAPATALIVAHLFVHWNDERWKSVFYIIQFSTSVLLLATAALVNTWAFPLKIQ